MQLTPLMGGDDEKARLDELERCFERGEISRTSWNVLVAFLALLALLGSAMGVAFGIRAIDESERRAAAGGSATVAATLTEFAIALSSDQVGEGATIKIANAGTQLHNLVVRDTALASKDLLGGDVDTLSLRGLAAGTYELYCKITGHVDAGMKATLTVGAAGAGSAAAAGHGEPPLTAAEGAIQDQAMIDSVAKFPAETAGRGNQLLVPEVLADGTQRFELTAAITDWEVRPGECHRPEPRRQELPCRGDLRGAGRGG